MKLLLPLSLFCSDHLVTLADTSVLVSLFALVILGLVEFACCVLGVSACSCCSQDVDDVTEDHSW